MCTRYGTGWIRNSMYGYHLIVYSSYVKGRVRNTVYGLPTYNLCTSYGTGWVWNTVYGYQLLMCLQVMVQSDLGKPSMKKH